MVLKPADIVIIYQTAWENVHGSSFIVFRCGLLLAEFTYTLQDYFTGTTESLGLYLQLFWCQ